MSKPAKICTTCKRPEKFIAGCSHPECQLRRPVTAAPGGYAIGGGRHIAETPALPESQKP